MSDALDGLVKEDTVSGFSSHFPFGFIFRAFFSFMNFLLFYFLAFYYRRGRGDIIL